MGSRRAMVVLSLAAVLAGPAAAGEGPQKEIAVLKTSMGTIEVELFRKDAPKTVENFIGLAGKKFFDGLRFHRVSKGFVIQTGDHFTRDPSLVPKWGTGGQSIYGKDFADELNPSTDSYRDGYRRGTVAMANRGPNTNTSQFFIMLIDLPEMPKNYTIFGKVVAGMDVVDAIGNVELDPPYSRDGRPKKDVVLTEVRVRKQGAPAKK